MKVLILGSSGNLGPHVVKHLETYPRYQLRLADIKPVETKHEFMKVDVSSIDDVMKAAQGMEVIMNLSVLRHDRQLAFDVSMLGAYNMMKAAVEYGIRRIINTGPHFVLAGSSYESYDFMINPDIPPHPGINLYALTKSLGQEICRVFTENYDLYVLCYLFYIFRDPASIESGTDLTPFTVSWSDAAEALRLGLEIDLSQLPSKNEAFFIFANLPHNKFSNAKAKRILGFSPKDELGKLWHKANKIIK